MSCKNGNSKNFKEIPKKILTYYLYYYILRWNFFWELSKISEQVIIITRLEGSFFPFSGYYPPFNCGAIPAGIFLFKTNNRNTRTYFTPCSRVSSVNFEYVITGWVVITCTCQDRCLAFQGFCCKYNFFSNNC